MIFDAHFHYAVCSERKLPFFDCNGYCALSCAHSSAEWEIQQSAPENILQAYGIHPQRCVGISDCDIDDECDFLERILRQNKLSAIGEAGFDYFTAEYKACAGIQEKIFCLQLDLAVKYKVPLVIHCRKANHKLFEYSRGLKSCPAVLFHSFMGTASEAESLLRRGINGFFSFGKQMMNNNKKVIDCVKELPVDSLLLETDAPFQTLRGEKNTLPSEIAIIYNEAAALRNVPFEQLCLAMEQNAARFIGKNIGNDIHNQNCYNHPYEYDKRI